jgi:pimeloyl-ACP methyl ester carboxylesterase
VTRVVFCHGLESGPVGTKSAALIEAGFDVVAPDFRGENLATRIGHLLKVLAETNHEVVLVGSSYGGAAALVATAANPGRVKALVLCAPALAHEELKGEAPAPKVPTVIIHGADDSVVPAAVSLSYYLKNPHVSLNMVPDGHRLGSPASLDLLVATVEGLLK